MLSGTGSSLIRWLVAVCVVTGLVGPPCPRLPTAIADASALIRVEQFGGVWWFVKPDGERFLSLGVNCVLPGTDRDQYDPARPVYAAFRHYDSTDHGPTRPSAG